MTLQTAAPRQTSGISLGLDAFFSCSNLCSRRCANPHKCNYYLYARCFLSRRCMNSHVCSFHFLYVVLPMDKYTICHFLLCCHRTHSEPTHTWNHIVNTSTSTQITPAYEISSGIDITPPSPYLLIRSPLHSEHTHIISRTLHNYHIHAYDSRTCDAKAVLVSPDELECES